MWHKIGAVDVWVVGCDWAANGEKFVIAESKDQAASFPAGMIRYLETALPGVIAIEKTAGSYPRGIRKEYLRLAKERGFVIVAIDPRIVGNMRRTLGIEKSNEADAKLILQLFLERPNLFRPYEDLDVPEKIAHKVRQNEIRQVAKDKIVIAREDKWRNGHAEELVAALGPVPATFDSEGRLKDILWKNKKRVWRAEQVVPVVCYALATLEARRGRKYFKGLCGLHNGGHKNIIRSQAHHWALATYMRKHLSADGLSNLAAQKKANKARNEFFEKGRKGTPPPTVPDTAEQILVRHAGKHAIAEAYDLVFRLVRDRARAAEEPLVQAAE